MQSNPPRGGGTIFQLFNWKFRVQDLILNVHAFFVLFRNLYGKIIQKEL